MSITEKEAIELGLQKPNLICNICQEDDIAYFVKLEIRERQGPPLVDNYIIGNVCGEHNDVKFNEILSHEKWLGIVQEFRKRGVHLNKRFCNIVIEEL